MKKNTIDNNQRMKFFLDEKIIGIDPGKSGGLTIYSISKNIIIESISMPETMQELLTLLKIYSKNSFCFLEKVQGLPGMSGSGMFTFGENYGHIAMALLSCKIPTETITPQKWQKEFQLGTKGKSTTSQWKNKLKQRAENLFPSIKITLSTSDSVLIMEYGRRNLKK